MKKRVYIVALGFLLLVICVGSWIQVTISQRYKAMETAAAGTAAYQLTACSTLRYGTAQNIDPCPTFWTAVARSSATGVTPTPAD